MTIPKIIHQTWKDQNIPSQFIPFVESWKSRHPGWQHILWTDRMNREFVACYFPNFLSAYDSYPYNIQRADAIRYLLLYKLGGVYVDLDVECLQNVEPLINGEASFYIAKEPAEHCAKYRKEMILCNGWMASVAQHGFLRAVIDELLESSSLQETTQHNTLGDLVLNSTGPFMLTKIFQLMQDRTTLQLLDHKYVHPLSRDAAWQLYLSEDATEQKAALRSQGTYAIHYFWGTWAPAACREIGSS
jgi:mannosyltransferase OCH1-like enzyme